jgi:DNA-binding MarR family transcriptional regulator
MESPRPPTLLALASYLAGHVSRIGHRGLVDALAEQQLRLPHFAVLAALHDFGSLAQHELADRLGLNRSHLVGYLDDLEAASHVARERDTSDRRRQTVVLEPSGARLFVTLTRLAKEYEATSLGALTAAEQRTLARLLQRVVIADDATNIDHGTR